MSMRVTVKLDRKKIENAVKAGGADGLFAAMDHLRTVSMDQVPLDQGVLKASCVAQVSEDGRQGVVSYDTPYAIRQHEEIGYRHQRGRKAKYLEDPANDAQVQREMLELMRGGMGKTMR